MVIRKGGNFVEVYLVFQNILSLVHTLLVIHDLMSLRKLTLLKNVIEESWLHFHSHLLLVSNGIFHFNFKFVLYLIRLVWLQGS